MKTRIIFLLAILCSTILSCDEQQIHLTSDYKFRIRETHLTKATIKEPSVINLKVEQENDVKGQLFKISYSPIEKYGKGHIIYKNKKYSPNEYFKISANTSVKIEYIPTTFIKESKFYLIAENPYNRKDSVLINQVISQMDFNITLKLKERIKVGKKYKASLLISNKDNDNSISYFTLWNFDNNKFKIHREGKDVNKVKYYDLGKSVLSDHIEYMSNSIGVANLALIIKDSNGYSKSIMKKISVENTNFNYNVESEKVDIPINTPVDIQQYFTTEDKTVHYKVKYDIASEGTLEKEKIVFEKNKEYALSKEKEILHYTPHKLGKHSIIFTAMDEFGYTKKDELIFNVKHIDYTFSSSLDKEIKINTKNPLNLFLSTSATQKTKYFIKYNTSKNIIIKDENGIIWEVGKEYPLVVGQTRLTLISNSSGEQQLEIYVRDENNNKKTVTHTYIVKHTAFEHSSDIKETMYINDESICYTSLVTEDESIKYKFSYDIDIAATVMLNNIPLIKNTQYNISSKQRTKLTIIPHELSDTGAKLIITVTDQNAQKSTKEYEFKVLHSPFNFELNKEQNSAAINRASNIYLNLEGNTKLKYKIKYFNNLKANLFIGKTRVFKNIETEITTGQTILKYIGNESGIDNLKVTITDQNGQAITKNIKLPVENIPFNITAKSPKDKYQKYSEFPIYLNLSGDENITYSVSYTKDLDADLEMNGIKWSQGESNQIKLGRATIKVKALATGNHYFTFTVTDQNGQKKKIGVPIEITKLDFSPVVKTTAANITVNKKSILDLKVESEESIIDYTWEYKIIEGKGKIYNSKQLEIAQNYAIPIQENKTSKLYFEGLTTGAVVVEFTFASSDKSIAKKTTRISYSVENVEYSLDAYNLTGDIFINERANLSLQLTQHTNNTNSSYSAIYSGSTGKLYKDGKHINQGVPFKIKVGTTNLSYEAKETGNNNLIFKVIDNNKYEKTAKLNIKIKAVGFNILAIPSRKDNIVNQETPINLSLTTDGSSVGISYKMYYTTTSNGYFVVDGNRINQGVPFKIKVGSSTVKYVGSSVGDHTVSLFVKDTPYTKTVQTQFNINYSPIVFALSGQVSKSEIFVSQENEINLTLNSAEKMDYKITPLFTAKGKFYYGNTEISSGIPFTPKIGNSTIKYVASGNEEQVHLKLTATQIDTGISKSLNLNFLVNYPEIEYRVISTPEVVVKSEGEIRLQITAKPNLKNLTYSFEYEYKSKLRSAVITYNGKTLEAASNCNLNSNDETLKFTPNTKGSYNLNFTLKSYINGTEISSNKKSITINSISNTFQLFSSINQSLLNAEHTSANNVYAIDEKAPIKISISPEISTKNNNYNAMLINDDNKGGKILIDGIEYGLGEEFPLTRKGLEKTIYYKTNETGNRNVRLKIISHNDKQNTKQTQVYLSFWNRPKILNASLISDSYHTGEWGTGRRVSKYWFIIDTEKTSNDLKHIDIFLERQDRSMPKERYKYGNNIGTDTPEMVLAFNYQNKEGRIYAKFYEGKDAGGSRMRNEDDGAHGKLIGDFQFIIFDDKNISSKAWKDNAIKFNVGW